MQWWHQLISSHICEFSSKSIIILQNRMYGDLISWCVVIWFLCGYSSFMIHIVNWWINLVNSSFFFNKYFFKFHHSTLSLLKIRLYDLFWFTFYNVVLVSWPDSWVLRVNFIKIKSFYYVILFIYFQVSSFNNKLIENWVL